MSKKITQEIFEEIRKKNAMNNRDSIPNSDDFIHYLNITIGIEPDFAKKLIKALINAHKIFAIEIASEDKNNEVPRIEGYVEADISTIRRLKLFYQDELIRQYESEHYKRVTYHQLIKEIMPIINTLNNTPLGQLANKAIMMNELERMMEKDFAEYAEEWKERNLEIEINKATASGIIDKPKKDAKPYNKNSEIILDEIGNKKGLNIKSFSNYISKNKNYPLDRVLKIYGVDFFLRAQMQRYEFSYLTKLIEAGKFLKISDLLLLRDMLAKVKKNSNNDAKLIALRDDILELERAITHRLYFSHNHKAD